MVPYGCLFCTVDIFSFDSNASGLVLNFLLISIPSRKEDHWQLCPKLLLSLVSLLTSLSQILSSFKAIFFAFLTFSASFRLFNFLHPHRHLPFCLQQMDHLLNLCFDFVYHRLFSNYRQQEFRNVQIYAWTQPHAKIKY